MGTAGVDVAFIITLMEHSYREEEEMRKAAEAEDKKHQTDVTVISGDAKKGAGMFKVSSKGNLREVMDPCLPLADSLRTMSYDTRGTEQDRS